MTNKHLATPPSDIALARLKVLLSSINSSYQKGEMILESDLINSYHEAINLFFDSLDGSITGVVSKIYSGSPADPLQYNLFTNAIQKDLEAIYSEVGALDRLIVSSFNSILSERTQALDISKRISNKLGDYLLYADASLGAGFFYGDSFSSLDRIEIGSSLVEGDECFTSPEEGVILLPLEGSPENPKIKTITINSRSNGTSGSNYQIDVTGHEDLEVIGDSEPNTWFEYEKVTSGVSSTPLILDLTLSLDRISVINHININPINFGTPTPVKVITIETSKDGIEYRSIKDEIPVKDFLSEEDKEEFSLSPSSSKYSGQGFYSFLPRKAQYIHVVLEQHTPYMIDTLNGPRLRYAIGLRDINILSRKFKSSGSLISTSFTSSNEIRKVSLWASENPTEVSSLSDISHFVSHDDGGTWTQIQPQGRDTFGIPEVINFNTISNQSISTSSPVLNLRHKISMKRDPKAFDGDMTIKQERINKLDIVSAPAGGSPEVALTETPIQDTVRVIMPFMGSFSCPRANVGEGAVGESPLMELDFVEFNIDTTGTDIRSDNKITGSVKYPLPFRKIPNLESRIRVFVNGSQLGYAIKTDTSLDETSKVYFLNKNGTEIQFGYVDSSDNQRGFVPTGGSKIQICLDGDNPSLRLTDRGYVLNLTAPSDGFKDSVSIVSIPDIDNKKDFRVRIPSGVSIYTPSDIGLEVVTSKTINKAKKSSSNYIGAKNITTFKTVDDKIISSNQLTFAKNSRLIIPYQGEQDEVNEAGTYFGKGQDGTLPPIFDSSLTSFYIEETDLSGNLIEGTDKAFPLLGRVAFVNGSDELSSINHYTFDSYTGTIYLGQPAPSDRIVTLVCKKIDAKIIPQEMWQYDTNLATKRIDTRKLLLDPKAVFSVKQQVPYTHNEGNPVNSIVLISGNEKGHSWFNRSIVRGTVKLTGLLSSSITMVEVPFIDGLRELVPLVEIFEEEISFNSAGSNLWTYQLKEVTGSSSIVGTLAFSPVRLLTSVSTPTSQFDITKRVLTPSSEGEWSVSSSGLITFCSSTTPNTHTVSYTYEYFDPGVDISGQYSIDYNNGVIYFARQLSENGIVSFETSCYSAFYNIGKIIPDTEIKEINTSSKKIIFSDTFGLQFLKQNTADKARPQIFKVLYDYYKKSTESLKDLEPYFSPICKEIAFRAVTSDLLEEL